MDARSSWTPKLSMAAAVLVVAITALAGCGGGVGSAAPPTIICGVVLSTSPAGAVVYDIASSDFNPSQPVNAPTVGGVVMVQVASGCATGSQVTIAPADAFKVVRVVKAADHLPVALVLRPRRSVSAVLIARQNGHEVGWLKLDISKNNLER